MTNRREIQRILNKIRALESRTTNHYMVYLSLNAEILYLMAGTIPEEAGTIPEEAGNIPEEAGTISVKAGTIPVKAETISVKVETISVKAETIPVTKKFTSVQGKWVSRRVDIICGKVERNKKGRYCITGLEKMII